VGQHERLAVDDEAHVADQALVEDAEDGGVLVDATLGTPLHGGAGRRVVMALASLLLYWYIPASVPVRYKITGASASAIASSIEAGIRDGRLAGGTVVRRCVRSPPRWR